MCLKLQCTWLCTVVQDGEDPFTRLERERKKNVKQNKRSEAANRAAADPASAAAAVPTTVRLSTKLDAASKRGQIAKGKALKADIAAASGLAGVATASMGKFDKRLTGEKGERKLPGLRKKHLPGEGGEAEGGMVAKALGKALRCVPTVAALESCWLRRCSMSVLDSQLCCAVCFDLVLAAVCFAAAATVCPSDAGRARASLLMCGVRLAIWSTKGGKTSTRTSRREARMEMASAKRGGKGASRTDGCPRRCLRRKQARPRSLGRVQKGQKASADRS